MKGVPYLGVAVAQALQKAGVKGHVRDLQLSDPRRFPAHEHLRTPERCAMIKTCMNEMSETVHYARMMI